MSERVYTATELLEEKPKGDVLLRNDRGQVWKVFACHGCQTCWDYVEDPGGDFEKDRVEPAYPHFLSAEPVPE
jgi:hypothetical protein